MLYINNIIYKFKKIRKNKYLFIFPTFKFYSLYIFIINTNSLTIINKIDNGIEINTNQKVDMIQWMKYSIFI
jgi:hypothetical protein